MPTLCWRCNANPLLTMQCQPLCRYDLAMIDNDLASPACQATPSATTPGETVGYNWTVCNDFRMDRAADIKALDSKKPVFVYRGGPFGCGKAISNSALPSKPSDTWFNYFENKTMTMGDTWLLDGKGT